MRPMTKAFLETGLFGELDLFKSAFELSISVKTGLRFRSEMGRYFATVSVKKV